MPYPSEHSCRLHEPGLYDEDSFRRIKRGNLVLIIGKKKGKTETEAQAYRYPVGDWEEAEARAHCKKAGGEFEPASEEDKAMPVGFEDWVMAAQDESVLDFEMKFHGSPRSPYGTHSSKGYPGGRAGWQKAWRVYLSGIPQGPIQGTIRRVSMIAAGMKCSIPEMSAEDLGPRPGGEGKLEGKLYETPDDYGLDKWKTPGDDDLNQEDIQLTCQDLEDLKRLCLQEIAARQKAREKEEGEKGLRLRELEQEIGAEDFMIGFGGEIKAVDSTSGKVGGYLVRFSIAGERDLTGVDYFAEDTYYGPRDGDGADTMVHHGMALKAGLEGLATRILAPIKTRRDAVGIWAETVLDLADEYEKVIYEMVQAGKLKWSSGTAARLARRETDGKISRWPIVEGSLTPTPMEPRLPAVMPLKAYLVLEAGTAEPGAGAGALGLEVVKARARVEMLLADVENAGS